MLNHQNIHSFSSASSEIAEPFLLEHANAYITILQTLVTQQYSFTTVTPRTHQIFLDQHVASGDVKLRDIFGWNLPYSLEQLSPFFRALIADTHAPHQQGPLVKSIFRVATLGDDIFLHSAFPTHSDNAVFFGPDTYRFARFIRQSLCHEHIVNKLHKNALKRPLRILDIGCGSGAGGIVAARALQKKTMFELILSDINPLALAYAQVNAAVAGITAALVKSDVVQAVEGEFDLIISNPPYLDDASQRTYRHGGEGLGRALSVRIAREAIARLAPGGTLLLYTGVAMTNENDPFLQALIPLLPSSVYDWDYEEIDPDVFSEELERATYHCAHRIAAVGLRVTRKVPVAGSVI